MAYDVAAQEAHARILIRDQDTLNPALSSADFLSSLQEVWADYFQRFGIYVETTTPDVTYNAPTITLGSEATARQWIDVQAVEVKFTGDVGYTPMGLSSWQRVLYLQTTEGQTGRARVCGLRMENPRNPSTDKSVVIAYFYPMPFPNGACRVVARRHPDLPDVGTDLLQIDNVHARYVTRIVAARAATNLGQPTEYVKWLLLPLPQQFREAMEINRYLAPSTQNVRQLEESRAA